MSAQSTSAPATENASTTGPSRAQQVGIVAAVALLIIASGVWLARSQGASELGSGGVNSSLLPKVGEPAPEFMTLYADGEVFRLSDLRGEGVWLNFWGSWCPPCRSEMPEIQAAWEELDARGFKMIGIAMQEDPRDAVTYRDRVGATFPVAVDPNYLAAVADPSAFPDLFATAATWEIRNFPTHVFIDADGVVRAVVIQQMDTDTAIEYAESVMTDEQKASASAGD
ncbi:MAG TPA: TlpA disulfide reductase family protein [Thermomicrobiales bacterium]|nr:TlpA disulfide reductase family protein [Thermomicrobiales bacterium]